MSKKIKHNCRNCEYSVSHGKEYLCYPPYLLGKYTEHSPKDSCELWKMKKEISESLAMKQNPIILEKED